MEITKWIGLRNTRAPERLKPGELDVAKDMDIDDSGAIQSRRGMELVSAVASHSMWAKGDLCLAVQGVDLKRMDASGTLAQLKRLQSGAPVSYAELNGTVYFTNGTDTGRVVGGEVKEWGIRRPVGQPVASATAGDLPPGRYQYAMTFVRSDGLESGTIAPEVFDLPSQGGILFSGLPTSSDPDVVGRALYLSGPGGETLFRHHLIPASHTTALAAEFRLGPDWTAGNAEPAPAGLAVWVHAGTAYVASDSVVWASDQYSLERFRRADRFLQFPGPVQVGGSVTDGMYVATDEETFYLAGNDPHRMKLTRVFSYGAIPGTMVEYDLQEEAGDDQPPRPSQTALLWMSPFGVIMGSPGGQARNLTEGDYSFPPGQIGSGLLRAARGYASYIATLKGAGTASNEH